MSRPTTQPKRGHTAETQRPLPQRLARAVVALAPARARPALRELLGPWSLTDFPATDAGSDLTRLTLDWIATCMAPDDEVRNSARKMRARAREMTRNNAHVASYLHLLTSNVIGPTGMSHQAKVRNNNGELSEGINKKIEDAWLEWSTGPVSLDGRLSLVEYEELALKTAAFDGESFNRMWTGPDHPFGLALEPLDADLVDETYNRRGLNVNEIRMGIEVNKYGRPVQYHVLDGYPSYILSVGGNRTAIPADQVIHVFRPRRVNQTRGVTWLGPCMIALRMLDGYEESELVAARVAAAKMGFFQSRTPAEAGEFQLDTKKPMKMEASPGTMEQLPVGWEFQEWNPSHPTAAFPTFVKACLRKASGALGVSYNALASDLEGVNYSSMRSGLLIERDVWRRIQQWWIGQFRRRVYHAWLNQAILSGALVLDNRDFRRFTAVKWTPRGWPWVDPLKDGQAAILLIQNGMGSRTGYLAEQGLDYEAVLEELAEEEKIAKVKGVNITGPAENPKAGTVKDDEDDDKKNGDGKGREAVLAAVRHLHR